MRSINLKKAVTWALVGSLAAFGSATGAPCGYGSGAGGKQPVSEASDASGGNPPLSEVSSPGRGKQPVSVASNRGGGKRPSSDVPGGGAGQQPGPDEPKGGGGNKPPFEVSNNLAYPSVVVGGGAEAYYDIKFAEAVLGKAELDGFVAIRVLRFPLDYGARPRLEKSHVDLTAIFEKQARHAQLLT